MQKKALLIILAVLILSGCGYRMVITGQKAAFTIYPSLMENYSDEISATSALKDGVNLYLASINALGKDGKADFNGEFVLDSVRYTGAAGSTSASTANVRATMQIKITDNSGGEVFSRSFSASENYSNTASASDSRANRDEALAEAINRIMTDFRNAFERK